ncbi:MAG: hypothetical protein DMG65_25720 [Candidatus Angelobacter sp. Gp1-AA117]|nr:MAG: hypothetical protein DMG65_25720 [Candidatus Angelobacter sp. Gp1-AA117]
MRPRLLAPGTITAKCKPAGRLGFGFGRRFFLLILLGVLWCVPAFWSNKFFLIMAAWDACVFAAWAVDLWLLPRAGRLTVERSWTGTASLSNNVDIMVQVQNESAVPLACSVLEDVPQSLRNEPAVVEIKIPRRSSASQTYTVRPLQRGDIEIGGAYLRYQSLARFAERWARADLKQTIRVYPDLEEAKRQNIYLSRARQIELEKRLVRQRGMGREFESLREYREGDEFRNICWTATARRGKHVTKIYQVERSQAVWLVIDAGRLLRAKVGDLSKLDLATNAALSLAQIALYSGDRVGLLVYGRKVQQRIGLGKGLSHMRLLMDGLANAHEEIAEADHLYAASSLLQIQNPDSAEEMYETVAAQEIVQRREQLISRVRDKGALALEIHPNKLTTTIVNQYLEIKERSLI